MKFAVVCYLYEGPANYRAEHVNILRRMVARNCTLPHEFWCVGDDPTGLDPGVNFYRCDRSMLSLGGCYVKLQMWRREVQEIFGDRILLLDLDSVICGNIDRLVLRPEAVVLWRDALAGSVKGFLYNGSMILMDAGARPQVWESFDAKNSPQVVAQSGMQMYEQAWIGLVLGPNEATFTAADGVLSYKFDGVRDHGLRDNAAVVFFHGRPKPWEVDDPWVKEYWR